MYFFREWPEGEGIICDEDEFGVVLDLAVDDGFGGDGEFSHSGAGGVQLEVVVIVHLFTQLLEDGFAKGIDCFVYLYLYSDLFLAGGQE